MKPTDVSPLRLLLCTVLWLCCSCGGGGTVSRNAESVATADFPDQVATDPVEEAGEWADTLLSQMSLEEKVGQLFMPAVYASADPSTLEALRDWIADHHVGAVMMLRGNLESASHLASYIDSLSVIRPMIAIDAEWGLGMRLKDAPVFPANGHIDASVTPETMYEYGAEVARQCRLAGINMILGPVLDVAPPGKKGVMGNRAFGSEPERVAELGVAYARGLEDGDVMSVAKHFPGHGSAPADSHKVLPSIDRSLQQLEECDLLPFRRYVEAGLSGMMVGHIAVPAIDSSHRPAAVSPVVIGDLLRGDMHYEGLVLTDALNMGGAAGFSAADALRAGADMIIAPSRVTSEIGNILQAINDGTLDEALIDDRCRRVLFYKYLVSIPAPGRLSEVASLQSARIAEALRGR